MDPSDGPARVWLDELDAHVPVKASTKDPK